MNAGRRTDDRIDRLVVHLSDVVGEGTGGVDDALGLRRPRFTWNKLECFTLANIFASVFLFLFLYSKYDNRNNFSYYQNK